MEVVIIEDEAWAVDRLANLLHEYDPHTEIKAVLDTVQGAVAYFQSHPSPPLIFLDIELGDGKSFDIFSQAEINSYIIFVTAFDEYALQAFKYNSIDYLLKPVKKEDLHFAVDKYKAQNTRRLSSADLGQLVKQLQPGRSKEYKTRFLVKRGSHFSSVETKDVAHVYTAGRVHFIKTKEGKDYLIEYNLDELEDQLPPEMFFRANRQFILNYSTIVDVISWFDGKLKVVVKPASNEEIIVSRLKAGEFKNWLNR